MKKFILGAMICLVAYLMVDNLHSCQKKELPKEIIKIDGKKYEVLKREVDTIVITKFATKFKQGKDIYHETIKYLHDTITVAQIKDIEVISKDTFKLEFGYVSVLDSIKGNRIKSRKWNAELKQKTIHEKIVVKEPKKREIYLGGFGNSNNQIGGGLLYKDKKDNVIGIGIGLDGSINASFYKKIL